MPKPMLWWSQEPSIKLKEINLSGNTANQNGLLSTPLFHLAGKNGVTF
jgi:hypothetical protein